MSIEHLSPSTQQVVIIGGMHRSGTSMVANILHLAGVFLGDPDLMLGASKDNQKGHWENIYFLDLNERILAKLGAGWDFICNLTDGWEKSPSLDLLRQQANQLVSKFERYSFWGWKDPRNTVLASFWHSLLPTAKFIICLRNPAEVAQSLSKRNNFSKAASYHLWSSYYQVFLESIEKKDYIITHYDSWFYNPQAELSRLGEFIGLPLSESIITESCKEISHSLRHDRVDSEQFQELDVPNEVKRLYQELCQEAGFVYKETLRNWSNSPYIHTQEPTSETFFFASEKDAARYAQLFVPTARGYQEECSCFTTVVPGSTKTYYFYPVIEESLDHYQFRIDPFNQAGLIDIASITIRANDKPYPIWSVNKQLGGFEAIQVSGTAKQLNGKKDSLYLFSYGNDPQIILPPISSNSISKTLEIEITMRIISDYKELIDYISLLEELLEEPCGQILKLSSSKAPSSSLNIPFLLNQIVDHLAQNRFQEAQENLATLLWSYPDNLGAQVLLDYLTQISKSNPALRLSDLSPFVALNLDAPREGDIIKGFATIYGWILAYQSDETFDIRITIDYCDHDLIIERGEREDVLRNYESYREQNPLPGFGTTLDTTRLEDGEHLLIVNAIGPQIAEQIGKVRFYVNNHNI
ncbi:MAG: sulfotransferase family protein [Chloroflexota bacterium]